MQNTMRFSELHCREVINLCDGARMGEVSDLLFDPVCGQITAGEDYILVRYREK